MIRAATRRDAPILARLRYQFRASFGFPEEEEAPFLERCEAWIANRLNPNGIWQAWIAEVDGDAVGTIWLQWIEKIPNPVTEPEWHGYISSLFVLEAFRGRSLGDQLLQTALDACREREIDAVILWPTPLSRTLYQRHGFTDRTGLMELRALSTG